MTKYKVKLLFIDEDTRLKNLGEITSSVFDLNRVAVIDTGKTPHRNTTFRELNSYSNGVASFLANQNFTKKSKIAIVADNSTEFIIAFHGILKSGMIAILINAKLPETQIQQILKDSQCSFVFCDQKYSSVLPESQNRIVIESDFGKIAKIDHFPSVEVEDEDVAFIMYTSGSTSDAVGVEHLHKALNWRITQSVQLFNKYTRLPNFVGYVLGPFFHMNGFFSSQSLLAGGGTIVIQPGFDSLSFINSIEMYRVVFLTGVPSMMAIVIDFMKSQPTRTFESVRGIMLGSAPLSDNLSNEIKLRFPKAKIRNNYGLTEVGPNLFGLHPQGITTPKGSVGYPREGIEYKLVNDILYIRSPSMMRGYSKSKQDVSTRITSDGFFNTKDIFRVDADGFYYFVSRSDDMIVCGGHNVYLSNIEQILEKHSAVYQAVSVALDDKIKGQKPYAFVMLEKDVPISGEELKDHVMKELPPYAAPRKIWKIQKVPVGSTGKVDRKLLQKISSELVAETYTHDAFGISEL